MSSSVIKGGTYFGVKGVRSRMGLVGNEAVNSQHDGPGVVGSFYHCTKGYYPK
jgi:hypothetical protein